MKTVTMNAQDDVRRLRRERHARAEGGAVESSTTKPPGDRAEASKVAPPRLKAAIEDAGQDVAA
jgi:hypothetical protein